MGKYLMVRVKILILVVSVFLTGAGLLGVYSGFKIKESVINTAVQKLESDLNMAERLLDQTIIGSWEINEKGNLVKGNTVINNDYTFVDEVQSLTGGNSVTIFQGDTRVSTNVRNEEGDRAVNTKASQVIVDTVLNKGETYYGEAEVVGVLHQTAYKPIKDSQGEIIGMLFVGVPNEPYDDIANKFITTLTIVMIVGIALASFAVWVALRHFLVPLERITKITLDISDGNLRERKLNTDTRDEIGNLSYGVTKMMGKLREIVAQLQQTSEELGETSKQVYMGIDKSIEATESINTAINQVLIGANTQLEATHDTAQATQESAIGVQRIAEASHIVNDNSTKMLEQANEGNSYIEKTMKQMENINNVVGESRESIHSLQEYSKEINKMVMLITGVADQTNLLALNASIEAARAGEQGRGFSVVAEEIRKLAEETTNATKQVSDLVSSIQKDTEDSVKLMDKVSREVYSGIEIADRTGNIFSEILESAKNVDTQIAEITSISEQMSASVEEVTSSIQNIESIARDTADAIESISESSRAQEAVSGQLREMAENLQKASESLNEIVNTFRLE